MFICQIQSWNHSSWENMMIALITHLIIWLIFMATPVNRIVCMLHFISTKFREFVGIRITDTLWMKTKKHSKRRRILSESMQKPAMSFSRIFQPNQVISLIKGFQIITSSFQAAVLQHSQWVRAVLAYNSSIYRTSRYCRRRHRRRRHPAMFQLFHFKIYFRNVFHIA